MIKTAPYYILEKSVYRNHGSEITENNLKAEYEEITVLTLIMYKLNPPGQQSQYITFNEFSCN